MFLNQEQLSGYAERGFLLLENLFDTEEVEALRQAYERDAEIPGEHRIAERDGQQVRAVYACHQRQPEFAALIRSPRLLDPVQQLLGADVYVYQFKINSKPAFVGEGWSWHQDFLAWKVADQLQAPQLINIALFLDEVTEFNGPVIFVPGSHRRGLVRDSHDLRSRSEQHLDPDDIALSQEAIRVLTDRHGMESAKGGAGSVVLFDSQIVHGSATNMSPRWRRMLFVTYNDVRNIPRRVVDARPEYLVGRDTEPLRPTTSTRR